MSVSTAPYTSPGPDQVVVRSRAVAINLVDWMKQDVGNMMFRWIKHPFILGNDVAGEIVEVGANIEKTGRFKAGQRVIGLALGMDPRSAKSEESAFQEYVVLRSNVVCDIPDEISYERASVLPLCLSTAATGLFVDKYLGLRLPSLDNYQQHNDAGDVVLVWGASTAVGMNAVQLLTAAGYRVVATAGKHNFDTVRSLGAVDIYSYSSKTAVRDIVNAIGPLTSGGKNKVAGAMAIGEGSIKPCIDILAKTCTSGERKFVAALSLDGPAKAGSGPFGIVLFLAQMMWGQATTFLKKTLKGVTVRFVWGSDLVDGDVARAVYHDFLPAALASGKFVPMPETQIVGHGLDKIPEAFEIGKKGLSARKLVVTV